MARAFAPSPKAAPPSPAARQAVTDAAESSQAAARAREAEELAAAHAAAVAPMAVPPSPTRLGSIDLGRLPAVEEEAAGEDREERAGLSVAELAARFAARALQARATQDARRTREGTQSQDRDLLGALTGMPRANTQ